MTSALNSAATGSTGDAATSVKALQRHQRDEYHEPAQAVPEKGDRNAPAYAHGCVCAVFVRMRMAVHDGVPRHHAFILRMCMGVSLRARMAVVVRMRRWLVAYGHVHFQSCMFQVRG